MAVPQSAPDISAPPLLAIILAIIFLAMYVRIVIYFINDLYQPERRVVGGNKDVWLVIILVGSIVGMMAYLLFGREN